MKKIRMNVAGRVQGVGFRFMTKIIADELGITGFARNEDDGSVTIEAVGPEDKINLFIQKVKASPSPYGRVNHFEIEEDFQIKETSRFSAL